jgi:hypothetical protein
LNVTTSRNLSSLRTPCVNPLTDTPEDQKKTAEFAEWILKIGDGLIGIKKMRPG